MTTIFSVDSGRCAHKTKVKADVLAGGKIAVSIETSCENVKKYSELLKEVNTRDLLKPIITNPIYVVASGAVGPECPVPCAVVSCTWTEAGMVSKNLLKQFRNMCISYEDETDEK